MAKQGDRRIFLNGPSSPVFRNFSLGNQGYGRAEGGARPHWLVTITNVNSTHVAFSGSREMAGEHKACGEFLFAGMIKPRQGVPNYTLRLFSL